MFNYTIIPLDIEHVDEICEDIKFQYKNGIADCALFSMPLVPEGNPTIDKATEFCEKYDLFSNKLAEMGLVCGILAQSTIGHGYALDEMFSFTQYEGLKDGKMLNVCCPYDEDFRKHFFNQFAILAKHNPKIIMVDDDFRLMFRGSGGCACKLHRERIAELYGEKLTRAEINERISSGDKDLHDVFYKTQGESLIEAAKVMRAGIDSVNPSIPGVFCTCGVNAEFAYEIANVLAGEGNPSVVRINNARYTSVGARNFSPVMYRAARQIALLKDKADAILAETDTCPQNRYSTSASNLHSHFTASILEGCSGAKHWITRTIAYEPGSGKAYRNILSKYEKFYKKLCELSPDLIPVGCRIPIPNTPTKQLGCDNQYENGWHSYFLERMGLPFYFSHDFGGVAFLDGNDTDIYSDDELKKILSGEVVLSVDAAEEIIKRGYNEYIGVNVAPWNGECASGERLVSNGNCFSSQVGLKQLIPINESVETLTEVYHISNGKYKEVLFPGSTRYKNKYGGEVITFCGTPKTEYHYCTAFSYLNESRKKEFVDFLSEGKNLDVWYKGDAEICLRAYRSKSDKNELICAIYNLGFDRLEEIPLGLFSEVLLAERLTSDGLWENIDFVNMRNEIVLQTQSDVLIPEIIKITKKAVR